MTLFQGVPWHSALHIAILFISEWTPHDITLDRSCVVALILYVDLQIFILCVFVSFQEWS